MKKVWSLLLLLVLVLFASIASAQDTEGNALLPDVEVVFGQWSESYTLHMYDNDTAVELYRNITDTGRQLPVYDFDNYEGWEYFQYYDIPSRYSIPAGDQQLIEKETAGELYYSAPNRIILFYQDAEIPMTMTKIGYFDNTQEFRDAVAGNKPLEYWGNLLFLIHYAQ